MIGRVYLGAAMKQLRVSERARLPLVVLGVALTCTVLEVALSTNLQREGWNWNALSAIGTVGAAAIALFQIVLLRQRELAMAEALRDERERLARLVAAGINVRVSALRTAITGFLTNHTERDLDQVPISEIHQVRKAIAAAMVEVSVDAFRALAGGKDKAAKALAMGLGHVDSLLREIDALIQTLSIRDAEIARAVLLLRALERAAHVDKLLGQFQLAYHDDVPSDDPDWEA